MIRKTIQTVALGLLVTFGAQAQNSSTLLTIGDKEFSSEEFNFIYDKNNSFSETKQSKKEYIDLFVNYKLKVAEAEAQGLDTVPAFVKEFNYYKKELAKPYLTDQAITDQLLKEAYEHLKVEVDASHILLRLDENASPEDTLKVYEKLMGIKKQAEEGADFGVLAQKYSEDPSAKQNKGHLGYFKGFMMVYPFEHAAYNTEVGQLSEITRTSFGYHLIKVNDKREDRGELLTAHIMMMFPQNATSEIKAEKKAKIDSVYQLVLKGDDFGALATSYSEDRRSATNNGELPWFGAGKMIPEYSEPAFELDSVNNISAVVESPYGFHIIKLLDKRSIASFEEMEEEIKGKIKRDERANKGTKSLVARLKKEYSYSENGANMSLVKDKGTSTDLSNEDYVELLNSEDAVLFTLADSSYTGADLAKFIIDNRTYTKAKRIKEFDAMFEAFADEKILSYEEAHLEEKYPEYRFLVDEYHDGLLIFEISQAEIWNKANEDSIGIQNYFNANSKSYYEPEQIQGEIAFFKSKKDQKAFSKIAKSTILSDFDSIKSTMPEPNKIKLVKGTFSRGDFKTVDAQIWKDKKSEGNVDKEFPYSFARGKTIPKVYKALDETKGQVIADYQTELEAQWLSVLKEKLNPIVNKKAL
ncbi:peptidylprolyl isomerase [Saccharicrinis aurantiacus]|uniref:peptidylprolyl isomerase n=1 Tax=Saccharicrinis aurantiacus TaxID=1849719 RepID=UPI00094F987D|nr:peptidylprolyl isomerase [Saccharicrinis aurantiacus]